MTGRRPLAVYAITRHGLKIADTLLAGLPDADLFVSEKLSAPLTWELVQGASKPGFLQGLKANLEYSYRDRLPQIEVPTLIVWGRNDMIVPVGDAHRYKRLIGPNAHKVIFEDTGHVPMLERPTRFNALLAEFLAGTPEPERDVAGVTADAGRA